MPKKKLGKKKAKQLVKSLLINEKHKWARKELGMRVWKSETLTKECYLCKHKGSLENQLIPRWLSKEVMVSVCAGCYERSVGWVKVDNAVKITDYGIDDEFAKTFAYLKN